MTRWAQGAATLEDMINTGDLEVVEASREHADLLIDDARLHLESAQTLAEHDPKAAYSVMYDGVRKALSAILARQGLRATSQGGHIAVSEALRAQMGQASPVIRTFGGMRRRRHAAEYPSLDAPAIVESDVRDAMPDARAMVAAASKMVEVVDGWQS